MPEELPNNLDTTGNQDAADHDNRLQAIQNRAVTPAEGVNQAVATPTGLAPVNQTPKIELVSWESDSRIFDPKNIQWFIGLLAIGILLVVVFAIFQEFMLILLTAALIFVLFALARVPPSRIRHSIYNIGVESAGRMFLWKELNSFWVYTHKGYSVLRLDTKMHFAHSLEILLEDITDEEVEDVLIQYLPALEKPAPETEAMVDNALTSVAGKIPGSRKMMGWLEKQVGAASGTAPKE